MLDDNRLRIFSVLAEEGNFTRAARRLRVSQPAVSQSISELEKGLGVKLFERTRAAATLTPEGVTFRTYAAEILKWYDATDRMFGPGGRLTSGRPVSISCPAMAAESILPSLLSDLTGITPDAFTVTIVPDDAEPDSGEDIILYTRPRKETLDFEESASLAGTVSAAAGSADADADPASAKLAVWKPYEKLLSPEPLSRVCFSSDSPAAAIRLTERVPGMVCLVPCICLKESRLKVLPDPLPSLLLDLHIRFGRRLSSAPVQMVLLRKLNTIII